jgi:hypothetical protein
MGVALLIFGHLSRQLGEVTQARRYYRWNYAAAALVWCGMLMRFSYMVQGNDALLASNQNVLYTLVSNGFPALGATIGLVVTWHYWSWLLAERD